MGTRNIKLETLTKCLSVLKEMKYIADNEIKMDPKNIASKHHTSEAIPTSAKKVGFFTTTGFGGKLICAKDHFDPIDARKVLDNVYDNQKRKKRRIIRDITERQIYGDEIIQRPDYGNQKSEIPPKLEDVEKYCNERQNDVNPAKFMAYYEQNGWKVGKNKMKNWKMAIHTWEHKNYNFVTGKKLSEYTITELTDEFKRRGYTGTILPPSNEIKF